MPNTLQVGKFCRLVGKKKTYITIDLRPQNVHIHVHEQSAARGQFTLIDPDSAGTEESEAIKEILARRKDVNMHLPRPVNGGITREELFRILREFLKHH